MPTVLLLKVFGAWKRHQQAESDRFRKSTANYRGLIRKNGLKLFRWLRAWTRQRRKIRQAWMRAGRAKHNHQLFLKRLVPFLVWRALINYRKILRMRVRAECHKFRREVLPEDFCASPMVLTANAEKRLFKARSQGRSAQQEEEEEVEDGADKDKDKDRERDNMSRATTKKRKSRRKKRVKVAAFNWKANVDRMYDMDSEGEDEEDLPEMVRSRYPFPAVSAAVPVASSALKALSTTQLAFLVNKDSRALRLVRSMYDGLCAADQWNLFEAALRFHRFAYRALNNLRINAAYKVKAKMMRQRRIKAIKLIVFNEFKKIYDTRLGKGNSVSISEVSDSDRLLPPVDLTLLIVSWQAERLNHLVRAHLISKSTRLRGATNDIKMHLGKEEDEVDDEERAAK
jgi:hypothetical protein